MFGNIELTAFRVEAILDNYLIRGELRPRGHMLAFLNDRNWNYIAFQNCDLFPFAADSRVNNMKQRLLVINKRRLALIGLMDPEQALTTQLQLQAAGRAVVCYFNRFAVQGSIHVHSEAPDEDLLDEMHDFFALSDVSIYPIRRVPVPPTNKVSLTFFNRHLLEAYQVPPKS